MSMNAGDKLATAVLEQREEISPGVSRGVCFHRKVEVSGAWAHCPNCGDFSYVTTLMPPRTIIQKEKRP